MRYLIQNKKEFAITIAAAIMAIVNLIRAIRSREVTEELIVAVLVTCTTAAAWFYNMPTSEENCIATGQMRLAKEQDRDVIPGEDFTDEVEDEDETEEDPEDEETDEEPDDDDEGDADPEDGEDINDGPNDDGGDE